MRGKRVLGLLLLCIFCSSCVLDSGNVSLDTEGTEHSITQIEDVVYSMHREAGEGRFFDVEIHYPQLADGTEEKKAAVNERLKDAAFAIYGANAETEIEALNAEFEKMDRNESLNVTYELLEVNEEAISVVYSVDSFDGSRPYMQQYMVTVDRQKGQYLYFDDVEVALGEKFPDIPKAYYKVLKQYEDILKEKNLNINDCMEKFYVGGEWEYVDMELYVAGWDDGIYYSLYDLTGDGFPELLMGWMDSVETVYWPYVMYTVGDGETIEKYTFGAMPTVVCDNGAIITYGHVEYVMIMQFQVDTGQWRYVDVWSEDNVNVWSEERPEDIKRYYSSEFEGEYTLEKGEQKEEISQMDYNRIIDQYKTTPVMLEWALFH